MRESSIALEEVQAICGAGSVKEWRNLYWKAFHRRVHASLPRGDEGWRDMADADASDLDRLDRMSLRSAQPQQDYLRGFGIAAKLLTLQGKSKPQLVILVNPPENGRHNEAVVVVLERVIDDLNARCTDLFLRSERAKSSVEGRLEALRVHNATLRPKLVVMKPDGTRRRPPRATTLPTPR